MGVGGDLNVCTDLQKDEQLHAVKCAVAGVCAGKKIETTPYIYANIKGQKG